MFGDFINFEYLIAKEKRGRRRKEMISNLYRRVLGNICEYSCKMDVIGCPYGGILLGLLCWIESVLLGFLRWGTCIVISFGGYLRTVMVPEYCAGP